ncbi:MAG: hypothetical protein FJY53_01665 [Betaproteobacteria bacterium]|nr:hypothetical protein [Betaproteobacteria bacterium]
MGKLLRGLVVLGLVFSAYAQAADVSDEPKSAKMLMYIQPIEYTHPILLWHPYQGYWFAPGPIVEVVAKDKLTQAYGNVSVCEGQQSGKVLVWLRPRMFYNPQVQLFYGEVTASVYSGVGKFITSYEGESKLHGRLDIKAEERIAQTFTLAIDSMVEKMQADQALQAMLNQSAMVADNELTPCSMVTLLPVPKVRVTSF